MEFYHEEAGKILAVIMTMPAGDEGSRLDALMKFADAARMRASSQAVRRGSGPIHLPSQGGGALRRAAG